MATPMRAALPRPSLSIQLTAALAATDRVAPMPRAYSSDCVANIVLTWEQNRCTHRRSWQVMPAWVWRDVRSVFFFFFFDAGSDTCMAGLWQVERDVHAQLDTSTSAKSPV